MAHDDGASRGRPQHAGRAHVSADQRVDQRGLAGARGAADHREQRRVDAAQPGDQVIGQLADQLAAVTLGRTRPTAPAAETSSVPALRPERPLRRRGRWLPSSLQPALGMSRRRAGCPQKVRRWHAIASAHAICPSDLKRCCQVTVAIPPAPISALISSGSRHQRRGRKSQISCGTGPLVRPPSICTGIDTRPRRAIRCIFRRSEPRTRVRVFRASGGRLPDARCRRAEALRHLPRRC